MLTQRTRVLKNSFLNSLSCCLFSQKAKSHYEILEVNQNFTQRQLRTKFLKKARKLHPDHNDSKQASQQFKKVKQAYQTLKDPHKKYMYDTGISVQPQNQSKMHQQFKQHVGRKYYENRWYNHSKSNYTDARDEFYESRKKNYYSFDSNPYLIKITLFISLLIGVFGYDLIKDTQFKQYQKMRMQKQLLQDPLEKKKSAIMKKYIQTRAMQNKINDE